VQVTSDVALDLHQGEVAGNLIGPCIQVPGYGRSLWPEPLCWEGCCATVTS